MSRIRKEYKSDFTTVGNDMYRDKELSLKGRGLLGTMLSLPETWNFSIAGLQSILNDGERSVRSGLSELERLGYLRRDRITDGSGKIIDWEYVFSDSRVFGNHEPLGRNAQLENADVDKSRQLNTNILKTNKYKCCCNSDDENMNSKSYVAEKNICLDLERFLSSPIVKRKIDRVNEANYGNTSWINPIKDFLNDTFSTASKRVIDKVNKYSDKEYERLFDLASGLVDDEPQYANLRNKSAFLIYAINSN